jgi:hypothetical protein
MMAKPEADEGEVATLERLRADEVAIGRELAEARADAEILVAAAHSRAAALASVVREEVDLEITRRREEERRALDETLRAARAETAAAIEGARRTAAQRAEAAISLAIATVLGRNA